MAQRSYRDDGGFQTNPTGSNTASRSHKSLGGLQPQKASAGTPPPWLPMQQNHDNHIRQIQIIKTGP